MSEERQVSKDAKLPKRTPRSTIKEFCKDASHKMVLRHRERTKVTPPPPKYYISEANGKLSLESGVDNFCALMEACGTTDLEFAEALVRDLSMATIEKPEKDEATLNAALTALSGLAPTDEMEAMLAAQMVAVHKAAMDMLGRAIRATELPSAEWQSAFAIKLLRTFPAQMEALRRYRSKGEQTVRVEHVTVNAGGQAIVGSVTSAGGGRVQQKTEEQPHAKNMDTKYLTHAPLPKMPCAHTARKAVPVPSNAERTLPDARRKVVGCAKRK